MNAFKFRKTAAETLWKLHGIFPIWKPNEISLPDLQSKIKQSILSSAGVQFKFVNDFELLVGPESNFSFEKSSGAYLSNDI